MLRQDRLTTPMPIAAYLFDMDGTFLDSERVWTRAMIRLVQDHGGHCTEDQMLRIVLGRSWNDVHLALVALAPPLASLGIQRCAQLARDEFKRLTQGGGLLIPDSAQLLRRLAKTKPTAIVSGSPRDDVIEGARLAGAHQDIQLFLGAEDYPRGKPAPDGYLTAARLLGVDPACCVVFEDSGAGVASAKAAGMMCVALRHREVPLEAVKQADWIVESLKEYSDDELLRRVQKR
ncbi:MAG: HAD family hydrolase [Kiritimatiellia bacterium]